MLNWGIAGTGPISDTVAKAIQKSKSSRLVAVAGRNADHTAAFQTRHEIPAAYADFDRFLADPSIDVVYVGLPNHIHHELTVRAAAAGKHVLCEKSLSIDMEKADLLLEAVERHGIFFVEGLMYLSHPIIARLQSFIQTGALGQLKSVIATYTDDAAHLVNPAGRGAIYNIGCYPASLLHLVVDTVWGPDAFPDREMVALGNISGRDSNVCEAALTIRFGTGLLASLQTAETHGMDHDFTVIGDKGRLRFLTNPWLPGGGRSAFSWEPFGARREEFTVDTENDAFFYQVKMVEASIASGRKEAERPCSTLRASRDLMVLLTTWEAQVRANAPRPAQP